VIKLKPSRRAALVTVIAGAGLFGVATAVQASVPDSGGIVHGCYNTSSAHGSPNGALRVIDTSKIGGSCASGESPLNWNVKGPTGPQGAQGIQGPQGVKGDKGDPGTTGSPGAAGTNGTNGTNGANGTDGISGYEIVTQDQAVAVGDSGIVRDACPAGKHVLGGGAELTDAAARWAPAVTGGSPYLGGVGWEATVESTFSPEMDQRWDDGNDFFGTTGEHIATVRVWAICAKTSS
jgi:Collagen triple helix repeat (20 copies)